MSERLDPEAVHALMNACFDGLGRIIQSNGGHIDKYIGDSIMALFGAPTAHDNDPIRAAQSAIEMQAFISDFTDRRERAQLVGQKFKMRIGLNCGRVLAGAVGTEGRRDYSVMGDVVNVASRLETAAEPGTILASSDFKRRVHQHFAFGQPRLFQLKGKEQPIEAYVLEGERSVAGTSVSTNDQLFVNRLSELELIRLALDGRRESSPWIELRGPLGIGKSRLAEVALARASRFRVVQATSRPTTASRPFALMRRLLFALYQEFSGSSALPQTCEQLVTAFRSIDDRLDPYVSAIWYIAAPDALELKAPDPDPLTFRRTLERGLAILLGNIARLETPHLLYFDAYDLSDKETRLFYEQLRPQPREAMPPVLTTARGDELPSPQATDVIEVSGFDDTTAQEFIRDLTDLAPLSSEVTKDIIQRAGGVPLFIKELVSKVEADARSGVGRSQGVRAGADCILPNSLLGVMISRLDRLEPRMREFLALCSVQGSEFQRSIAFNIWTESGGAPDEASTFIHALEQLSLIRPISSDAERWAFSQILLQNASYDQMLRRDRREVHKAVANALISAAGGELGVSPGILSMHYENSEQWQLAAQQNVRAGERAADLYANADALSRYARALSALEESADSNDRNNAVAFAANRGAALVRLRVGDYSALRSLAEKMIAAATSAEERAEALRLKAQGLMHSGELEVADRMLGEASRLAEPSQISSVSSSVSARIALDHADVCYRLGRNADAADRIEFGRKISDPRSKDIIRLDILEGRLAHTEGRFDQASALYERAYRFAIDAGSLSEEALTSNYMGNVARDSGRYEDAEAYFLRALEVWSHTGMTEAIAGAHNNLANLAISRGDLAGAAHHYGKSLSAFAEIGNADGKAISLMNLAILAIESGEPKTAVARADEATKLLEASGNRVLLGLASVIKGEALIDIDRKLDAELVFRNVLFEYTAATHPLAVAGAQRGLGRLHLAAGEFGLAIDAIERGLELYERLNRVQEAARTQVYLAHALDRQGNAVGARSHLDSARKKFAEIGASRDLARTNALLAGTGVSS